MTLPVQKPGRSRQDYQTPDEFMFAVKRRLGIAEFAIDLAASPTNAVAPRFYTAADDAFTQSWAFDGWCWLNSPFSNLAPWVARSFKQSRIGAQVAELVPAGVGANWWRDWVHQKAFVLFLNGRLTFVGETAPYPKDCALLLYGPTIAPGYDVWSWMKA